MSGPETFTDREREKFRKLLEVANSTSYDGEKEAALAAATRLAKSRGMTLHEAAGMSDRGRSRQEDKPLRKRRKKKQDSAEFGDSFTAPKETYRSESERLAAEKKKYDQAMADAIKRGLQVEEEQQTTKKPAASRRASSGSWRSRPDFIRVLLRETRMTPQEIASTAGVSVHEVYKEKLLMRRAS